MPVSANTVTLESPPVAGRELVLTNARIIGRHSVINGSVQIVNGKIGSVDRGRSKTSGAIDLENDFLAPGLVDIHTDNVERHLEPRPGVAWPAIAALLSHDRQIAGAGITTVFDSLYVGGADTPREQKRGNNLELSIGSLDVAAKDDLLKVNHLLHLRCEVVWKETVTFLERFIDNPAVRLVSVMDHTPGQRQWRDMEKWRQFNSRKFSNAEMDTILASRFGEQARFAGDNRAQIVRLAQDRGIALASHDDTTVEHIEEARAAGIEISEFPCTLEAARAARKHGMATVMGAPNLVKGGSHSGNVAARELAEAGLLDALASDYVPQSLVQAAFELHSSYGLSLPDAVAMVSYQPARMVGLLDRGEIAADRRADLIRIRVSNGLPVVRTVWCGGEQVA